MPRVVRPPASSTATSRAQERPLDDEQWRELLAERAKTVVAQRGQYAHVDALTRHDETLKTAWSAAADRYEADPSPKNREALEIVHEARVNAQDEIIRTLPVLNARARAVLRPPIRVTFKIVPERTRRAPRSPRARSTSSSTRGSPGRRSADDDPDLTRLQRAQCALRDVVVGAREALDIVEHKIFTDTLCELAAREAARHVAWERRRAA